ncbi:MAG: hypothetical protein N3D76_08460 [Geminocystis sp.]|nr:hypothetical protein [Geminocystis sp.]
MLHPSGLDIYPPFILPNSKESPLVLLKFLLFLHKENLIPLFLLDGVKFPINPLVYTRKGKVISAVDVIKHFQHNPPAVLFFGSHFLVNISGDFIFEFGEKELETFLLFTPHGLILEKQRKEYEFIPWKSWQGLDLYFYDGGALFTIVLKDELHGKIMTITSRIYNSTSATLENNLPLLLGYFVLKKIWHSTKMGESWMGVLGNNILFLNSKILLYIVNNILPDIQLGKEELGILIDSVSSWGEGE